MIRMRKWAAVILSAAIVLTGMQIPVFGAAEETLVGADEYEAHVYSERDFVSALNGEAKNIIVESDFNLTKTAAIAKDVTIQMAGHAIGADYTSISMPARVADTIHLVVAADKTVTIKSDKKRYGDYGSLSMMVENNGTVFLDTVDVLSAYGPAIINNSELTIQNSWLGSDARVSQQDLDAVIVNNGKIIMSQGTMVQSGSAIGVYNAAGAEYIMEAGAISVTDDYDYKYVGVSNNGIFVQRGGDIMQSSYGL